MRDIPTEKYPGVLLLFWLSSLSPSQFWTLNTTAALYGHRILSAHGGDQCPQAARRQLELPLLVSLRLAKMVVGAEVPPSIVALNRGLWWR